MFAPVHPYILVLIRFFFTPPHPTTGSKWATHIAPRTTCSSTTPFAESAKSTSCACLTRRGFPSAGMSSIVNVLICTSLGVFGRKNRLSVRRVSVLLSWLKKNKNTSVKTQITLSFWPCFHLRTPCFGIVTN